MYNSNNRQDNVVVDMYEKIDANGNIKYIDEYSYMEELEEKKRTLQKILFEIRNNNPANNKKHSNNTINLEKADNYKKPIYYGDEKIVTDYEDMPKSYKLKKVILGIGIMFGLASAIRATSHYKIDNVNNIKVTNDKKIDKEKINKKIFRKKHNIIPKKNKMMLDSRINLDNAILKYTSNGDNPCINTQKLDCDTYQINHIAITSNHDVVDVLKIDSTNKDMILDDFMQWCQMKYGDNIEFQINVDGIKRGRIAYKQAGWINLNKIMSKKNKNIKVKTL